MDFQEALEKVKKIVASKQGRIVVVLGTILGFSGLLANLGGDTPVRREEERKEYRTLIDEKTKKLYLRDIKAEQEETQKQVSKIEQEIEKLKRKLEQELAGPQPTQSKPIPQPTPAVGTLDQRLINELRALKQSINNLNNKINLLERKVEEQRAPVSPEEVFRYPVPKAQPPSQVQVVNPGQNNKENILLEGFFPAEEDKEVEEALKKISYSDRICIPQGSFGTVVALSGLSAPTGPRASQDPVPILFVIPDKFIKPNIRRTYDVKNCFAMGWGAGDLSSERIKIRVSSISCERREGQPIKLRVAGYIAGPDGKEGIKGILVEKRGQYLAKALMAAFVEGLSAVAKYSTSVISVSPLGATQTVPPEDAFKFGLGSGAERALRRLSDYYLQLADEVLPVIEVGSGVQGTLILLKEACHKQKDKSWKVAVEETKKRLVRNPVKPTITEPIKGQVESHFKPFYEGMME